MTMLALYIRENVNEKPVLKTAEALERELELVLGADLQFFLNKYAEAVEHIRAHKMNLGDSPVCYLNGILTFIELVSESPKDKYTVLYHKNRRGVNTIDYYCLDPSLAVQPLIEEVKGALIMSGTLSPLDLFADVIGLGEAEYKSYLSIQDPKKIRTYIDPHVTTTYRERSEEMILRIGRRIASELEKVENGALVFFPQRGFMHRCLDAWGVNGVIKTQRGRLQIGGKPLFIEGNNAVSNRDVVSRYKRSAVSPKGAVLNCVFRGRNSEGSNFPDQQARGIFLVGVPYANYGDPFVKAQISYYDKKSRGLGQGWYAMDAFRAANQALGRGIRGIDDWCQYWLLDRRYSRNIDLISKWVVSTPPEHLSALDTMPFGISVFDGD
jgi:Rad3-related DNA helicase